MMGSASSDMRGMDQQDITSGSELIIQDAGIVPRGAASWFEDLNSRSDLLATEVTKGRAANAGLTTRIALVILSAEIIVDWVW